MKIFSVNQFAAAPAPWGCCQVISLVCRKKLRSLNTEWNQVLLLIQCQNCIYRAQNRNPDHKE